MNQSIEERIRKKNVFAKVQCQKCSKFVFSKSLKRHMLTHSDVKAHRCPYCPYAACANYYLIHHIRKMHPGEEPFLCYEKHKKGELLKCPDCEYTTKWKRYLACRQKPHIYNKVLKCLDCSFSTLNKSKLLQNHLAKSKEINLHFT